MALLALEHQGSRGPVSTLRAAARARRDVQMRAGLTEGRLARRSPRSPRWPTVAAARSKRLLWPCSVSWTGTPVGTRAGIIAIDRARDQPACGKRSTDSAKATARCARLARATALWRCITSRSRAGRAQSAGRGNQPPRQRPCGAGWPRSTADASRSKGSPAPEERFALATEMVQTAEAAGDVENALRGHYRCYRELLELW